jgi:MbtH protein
VDSIFDDDARTFVVVRNDEEQYSIWPADRDPPRGWQPVGFVGVRRQGLAWIDETWTDMRPKSLREHRDH